MGGPLEPRRHAPAPVPAPGCRLRRQRLRGGRLEGRVRAFRGLGRMDRWTCPHGTARTSTSRSPTRRTGRPRAWVCGSTTSTGRGPPGTPTSRVGCPAGSVGDPSAIGSGPNPLDWTDPPTEDVGFVEGAATSMDPPDADFRTLYVGFGFENVTGDDARNELMRSRWTTSHRKRGGGAGGERRRPRRRSRAVGEGGVEPPRPCGHRNLNPARLPIPPLARGLES